MTRFFSRCHNDAGYSFGRRLVRASVIVAASFAYVCYVDFLAGARSSGWNAVFSIMLGALALKLLAIVCAISWIPAHARRFLLLLDQLRLSEPCYQRRRYLALKKGGHFIPPFGIMDSCLYSRCNELKQDSGRRRKAAFLLELMLTTFFSVSNLCYASAAVLVLVAYAGDVPSDPLRLSLALFSLFSIAAMARKSSSGWRC
ncbi:MAG TPA: hypothetical protein VFI31_07585 [Pirellulales bacterium]|nr:hypothetical protein [Pirellulales bacterium]